MIEHPFAILFALLIGHAFADYLLQGDFIARYKSPRLKLDTPDGPVTVWPYVMVAHCLIHAGFVWAITGSVWLGLCELTCHCLIDYHKCNGRFSFHQDQWWHIWCKFTWFLCIVWGVS